VLLEVARIMKKLSPDNRYTVEFVWFDGEELGLIGAKKYAHMHAHDSIGVMINMDMTGSPTGFNVMGTDELIPFFRDLCSGLNGFDMKEGVSSHMWTNSDHVPFMLLGVPTITPNAKLDEPMYKYYHDMGDSFDKVSKRYLSDAAAIIGITVMELANNSTLLLRRRSKDETLDLLRRHNSESRLKRQGELVFED
jgi:Zn-dependent M28 family amino/carboxypeptidase